MQRTAMEMQLGEWPGQNSLLSTPFPGYACDEFSTKMSEDGGTNLKQEFLAALASKVVCNLLLFFFFV